MLTKILAVLLVALLSPIGLLAQQAPTTAEVPYALSHYYERLPRLLNISWLEGPEYPLGIQDSAFAVVGNWVAKAGIACGIRRPSKLERSKIQTEL
jgi:hypothetical protein